MSGIAIPINVDRSQLTAAINDLRSFSRLRNEVLGGGNTTSAPREPSQREIDAFRQMEQQRGDNRAMPGINHLNMPGLDKSADRVYRTMQGWETAAKRYRDQLKAAAEEMAKLDKASINPKLSATGRQRILDRQSEIEDQSKRLEKQAATAENRAESARARLPEGYRPAPQLPPEDRDGNHRQQSAMRTMGRIAGWAAMVAGGWSIGGFLAQSRAKYQQSVEGEATLAARGIRGANAGAAMGYGPIEYQHLLGNLSHATGSNGKVAQRQALSASVFARSQGVDLGEASRLHQTTFAATGRNDLSPALMIGLTASGVDKSKMPALLEQIGKNTNIMASAQGGAGLDKNQMLLAAFAAVQAMREGKPDQAVYAKSQEFTNIMQNGMRGSSGSIAGDIMLGQITGMFDGAMSFKKIFQMEQTKEGGFFQRPDLLKSILERTRSFAGDDRESQAGALMQLFPHWGLTSKTSMMLTGAFTKGGILEGSSGNKAEMDKKLNALIARGGAEGKQAQQLRDEISKTPGMDRLSLQAQKEVVEIRVGQKIHETFSKFEMGALKLADALVDGNWQKSFAELTKSSGEMDGAAKMMVAAGAIQLGGAAMSAIPGGAGKAIAGRIAMPALAMLGTGAASYLAAKELMDFFTDGQYSKGKVTPDMPGYSDHAGGGKTGMRRKVEYIAKLKGVDPALGKAVAHTESGFNPLATSSAGAKGVMQVMASHFRQGEDPYNPDVNINKGMAYLQQMLKRYNGDEKKATAAYNAGPGAVDKAVKKYGEDWLSHMPKETRQYVPSVLARKQMYRSLPEEEALERSPLRLLSMGGQRGVEEAISKQDQKIKGPKKLMAPDGPYQDRTFEIMQNMRQQQLDYSPRFRVEPTKQESRSEPPPPTPAAPPQTVGDAATISLLQRIADNTSPQRPTITAGYINTGN